MTRTPWPAGEILSAGHATFCAIIALFRIDYIAISYATAQKVAMFHLLTKLHRSLIFTQSHR